MEWTIPRFKHNPTKPHVSTRRNCREKYFTKEAQNMYIIYIYTHKHECLCCKEQQVSQRFCTWPHICILTPSKTYRKPKVHRDKRRIFLGLRMCLKVECTRARKPDKICKATKDFLGGRVMIKVHVRVVSTQHAVGWLEPALHCHSF